MIDEWGNEVKENPLLSLRSKLFANRHLVLLLVSAAVFALAIIQAAVFFEKKKLLVGEAPEKPTSAVAQISPRAQKKLSPLATDSGFIKLEENAASLSAEIETADLYESGLMFPPVNVKIEFGGNK